MSHPPDPTQGVYPRLTALEARLTALEATTARLLTRWDEAFGPRPQRPWPPRVDLPLTPHHAVEEESP